MSGYVWIIYNWVRVCVRFVFEAGWAGVWLLTEQIFWSSPELRAFHSHACIAEVPKRPRTTIWRRVETRGCGIIWPPATYVLISTATSQRSTNKKRTNILDIGNDRNISKSLVLWNMIYIYFYFPIILGSCHHPKQQNCDSPHLLDHFITTKLLAFPGVPSLEVTRWVFFGWLGMAAEAGSHYGWATRICGVKLLYIVEVWAPTMAGIHRILGKKTAVIKHDNRIKIKTVLPRIKVHPQMLHTKLRYSDLTGHSNQQFYLKTAHNSPTTKMNLSES